MFKTIKYATKIAKNKSQELTLYIKKISMMKNSHNYNFV